LVDALANLKTYYLTDLNHIHLPASLVAGIYKNHLVETERLSQTERLTEKKKPSAKPAPGVYQYLGQNQKGICLLVDYANDVHLPGSQLDFLTSILQACKLNLGDVAIVNCGRQQVSFPTLTNQLACSHLLIFGVTPGAIGLDDIPMFSIQKEGSCHLLYSPAAENLNNASVESKLLKSKLWLCLKEMFAI
jgi:hypothetical protein